MLLFVVTVCLLPIILVIAPSPVDQTAGEDPDEIAEELANRTYSEHQTKLHAAILKTYDRSQRPVKNRTQPIDIAVHVYILHISINQKQQTMTLNGHIYMTWKDEMAVWNPDDYYGVSKTMFKQWELWMPDFRVINSASGVQSYFEISKRSHVILQTFTDYSRLDVYPTFTIKVGCMFDFSNFPNDAQSCPMVLFAKRRMSEVDLSIYYGVQPTVLLGWGDQSDKRHISDWEFLNVTSNISYFTSGKFTDDRPTTQATIEASWSLFNTYVIFRRNRNYFGVGAVLPAILTAFFTLASFWTLNFNNAIFLLVANLFVQAVFAREFNLTLPPSIGSAPRIVKFWAATTILTAFALLLHVTAKILVKKTGPSPSWCSKLTQLRQRIPWDPRIYDGDKPMVNVADDAATEEPETITDAPTQSQNADDWPLLVAMVRMAMGMMYLLILVILIAIYLL